MQPNRLARGGRIERSKELRFTFNGKSLGGYEGDSVASALLANGVDIVGRSFKYHRPRGIVGAGAEEPNAVVQIGTGATTEPNIRATQMPLYDGMVVRTVKGWPSLDVDVQEINGLFKGLFAAGFYYKTFMGPTKGAWNHFEKALRNMAAMGVAPTEPDPDYYSHQHAHCDVLVVGAGPAGLIAAQAAAQSGARVLIADEQEQFGGSLLASASTIDNVDSRQWVGTVQAELAENPLVQCLHRSTVFGYHDYNFLTIVEKCTEHLGERVADRPRQKLWKVRARQVVLAQGAFERPLVFCNNDRPGVMLASAVSAYIHRYGVAPGTSAVIFTNNDSAYKSALDLHRSGREVAAVIDSRHGGAGDIANAVKAAGITIRNGYVVTDVRGRKRVSGAIVTALNENGTELRGEDELITCDLIAMSGGWSPAVHLHSQSGGKNVWDAERLCFVPGQSAQPCLSAGAGNGTFDLAGCLAEGAMAGQAAATAAGYSAVDSYLPVVEQPAIHATAALWRVPSRNDPDAGPRAFLDYQNDTSVSDVRLAVREGFRNIEHVKRYTALGFGTDQGKLGNINGMAILAEILGEDIAAVGTTTFRPNYTPVTFGAIAGEDIGELYDPVRKTALHEWHRQAGAHFEVVGQWHRPWYFPLAGEDMQTAVNRECRKTRASLGIMDASTLGKIEVYGADAQKFLERIYTHDIAKLQVGRCAYGVMLGEDGMLMDDGVMARVGEQHYYLTTTTGGAAGVYAWLEQWLQTEWPDLDVFLTSTTDHNSTIAVVGPNARRLLEKFDSDVAFGQEDFPFMAVKAGRFAGFDVQIFRISFSGELAFELNIHSDFAMALWDGLMQAGEEFDITPYGTETLHVLRAEKGFVIVGQDTDGSVTPGDLGMHWLLSKNKDYLGRRSLSRTDCIRADRKQLVGLLCEDGKTVLPEGAQLVEDPDVPVPVPMCGHVTSSYNSACLGHPIALALVAGGRKRHGEVIYAALRDGRRIKVTIASPVFYDPKGDRQRV